MQIRSAYAEKYLHIALSIREGTILLFFRNYCTGGHSRKQASEPIMNEMARAIVLTSCEETVKYPQ
jgi:hypothetical protein